MEHVIKETPEETIKRFELYKNDIWLIKRNGKFGVGNSKKEAELLKNDYAYTTIPPFLYELGGTDPKARQEKLWAVPGLVNFIWQLISLRYQNLYIFNVIYHEESKTSCMILKSFFNSYKPRYFWTDEPGIIHDQIRKCVYQLYIEIEKGLKFETNEQNKKLGEWQRQWYSKLTCRRLI